LQRGTRAQHSGRSAIKTDMMRRLVAVVIVSMMVGCRSTAPDYYAIDGFYIFPLKQIRMGASLQDVRSALGQPANVFRTGFKEPKRVKLSTLPLFDEQWQYNGEMANDWVFFREGKMVAAFHEESDF
jgi:hypothetical protein